MPKDIEIAQTSGADVPAQCGAICWRMHRGGIQVLLITSRDTGRWVIPKGWPMADRTLSGAAAQEAWEEAGVRGQIDDVAIGTFAYDKILKPGKALACQVDVFPLRVAELSRRYPEACMRSRKWFKHSKAARLVNEPGLRGLLAGLPNLIATDPVA